MASAIGGFLGALVVMFLLSRLIQWILRRSVGDLPRILIASVMSFAIAVLLGGYGFARGAGPVFGYAASSYLLPTLIWLAVDMIAWRGRRSVG